MPDAVDTMRDDDEQSGLMYTCRYGFVERAELSSIATRRLI